MFGFPDAVEGSQKTIENVNSFINIIEKLWEIIDATNKTLDEFLNLAWKEVNCDKMEDAIKQSKKTLTSNIKGQVRKTDAYLDFFKHLKKWTTFVELIAELIDENMIVDDDRHWQAVRDLLKKNFKVTDNTQLRVLWEMNIDKYDEAIKDIGEQSKQEGKMKIALDKIAIFWEKAEFDTVQHKNTDVYLLKLDEDQTETMEDHQVQASTYAATKFVGYYEKTVQKWIRNLGTVSEIVDLLASASRSW
jgi:dynein heavy chain